MRFMDELIEDQTRTFARGEEVSVPLLTGLVGIETDKPLNRRTCGLRTAEGLSVFEVPSRTQTRPKSVLWVKAPHRFVDRPPGDASQEGPYSVRSDARTVVPSWTPVGYGIPLRDVSDSIKWPVRVAEGGHWLCVRKRDAFAHENETHYRVRQVGGAHEKQAHSCAGGPAPDSPRTGRHVWPWAPATPGNAGFVAGRTGGPRETLLLRMCCNKGQDADHDYRGVPREQ